MKSIAELARSVFFRFRKLLVALAILLAVGLAFSAVTSPWAIEGLGSSVIDYNVSIDRSYTSWEGDSRIEAKGTVYVGKSWLGFRAVKVELDLDFDSDRIPDADCMPDGSPFFTLSTSAGNAVAVCGSASLFDSESESIQPTELSTAAGTRFLRPGARTLYVKCDVASVWPAKGKTLAYFLIPDWDTEESPLPLLEVVAIWTGVDDDGSSSLRSRVATIVLG